MLCIHNTIIPHQAPADFPTLGRICLGGRPGAGKHRTETGGVEDSAMVVELPALALSWFRFLALLVSLRYLLQFSIARLVWATTSPWQKEAPTDSTGGGDRNARAWYPEWVPPAPRAQLSKYHYIFASPRSWYFFEKDSYTWPPPNELTPSDRDTSTFCVSSSASPPAPSVLSTPTVTCLSHFITSFPSITCHASKTSAAQ